MLIPEVRMEYRLRVKSPERTQAPRRPVRRRTLRLVVDHLENELDFLQSLLTNLTN